MTALPTVQASTLCLICSVPRLRRPLPRSLPSSLVSGRKITPSGTITFKPHSGR
ncbi:hypothetical protein MMC31_003325, partial [Peltigera leucophlebia]|nr:hypothetical protein [Peltigera leucophlebia]